MRLHIFIEELLYCTSFGAHHIQTQMAHHSGHEIRSPVRGAHCTGEQVTSNQLLNVPQKGERMFSQGINAHCSNSKPSTGLRQPNGTTKIMVCAINQVPLYNPVIYIHSLSRYILHQVLNYFKLLLRPISQLQKHYSEFTADIFLVALHLQTVGLEKLWYTQKVRRYWLGFENKS